MSGTIKASVIKTIFSRSAIIVFLLLWQSLSFAQITFQKMYGKTGERAYCVKQTFDGGFIVAGSTGSPTDILFMKTDAAGTLLWAKTYGGASDEHVNYIDQTRDSGYIIVGSTSSFGSGSGDVYLVKTDINGNVQWSKTYGGTEDDAGTYVSQVSDGGYMIAGGTNSYGQGNQDCYLIRTAANGQLLWAKTYGGTNSEAAYSARVTKDGGVIMVGETFSFIAKGPWDAYMVKVDSMGNLKWSKAVDFGGIQNAEEGFDVTETFDGGYVFSMEPEYVASTTSNGDFALLKLDSSGNFVWNNPVRGLPGWDFGYSIKQTNDSGLVVAGVSGLFTGQKTNAVLYKSDKNGNLLWFKSYGDAFNKRDAQCLDITSDGGFVVAGYIKDSSLGYIGDKFYLIKTDAIGNSNYCNEINDIPPGGPPTLIFTPGGVEGTGGVETTPLTITTVITLLDTVLPCSLLVPKSCPTANFSFTSICTGDSTSFTDLSTNPNGGSHLIDWKWDYDDGVTDTFHTSTNPKHKYSSLGPYHVKLTVANDSLCADSTVKVVTLTPKPTATINGSTTICNGDSSTLTAFGGTSYLWNTGNSTDSIVVSPTITTTYSVTASNGVCSDSETVIIIVNPDAVAGIISALHDTICSGTPVSLSVAGNSDTVHWQSSVTGNNFIEIPGADSTVYLIQPSQTTYFRVVVGRGICSDSSMPYQLTVNPVPSPPGITATDTLICSGDSTQVCASTGYNSYLWNTSATGTCIEAKNAGGYWVTITDANNCTAESNHIPIIIQPVPSVSIVVQGDTFSSFNAVAYQWYKDGLPINNATSSVYVAHEHGSYSVAVTDSNGCEAVSNPITFTGINEPEGESVQLYPNPSSVGNWQLAVGNGLIGSKLEVYDDNGRLVFQSAIRNPKSEIALEVARGVYLLHISSPKANIIRKLIRL